MRLYDLVYLPGKPGITKAVLTRTVSGVMDAIRNRRAAMSAGDYGAINVWTDNEGKLRAERMSHLITQDSQTFVTKKDMREWVKDALHTIHEGGK